MSWDSTVIQNAAYVSDFPSYPNNIHYRCFYFFQDPIKNHKLHFLVISLCSPLIWHSVLPYVSFLTFLKNSGHVFCKISFNLDLSDCFLMISFRVNVLVKNMSEVMLYACQCVPSRVWCQPDVSLMSACLSFVEVRFDHLIIPFIHLCLLDPSCSRGNHS